MVMVMIMAALLAFVLVMMRRMGGRRISGAIAPLPPLRERLEDLPGIMEYLLLQFAESFHVRPLPLSPAIIRRLRHYRWPGNIRELENVLRRYSLLGTPEALLEGLKLRSEALPVIDFPLHVSPPRQQFLPPRLESTGKLG